MIPHCVDLEVHPDNIHSSCISSVHNQSQTSSDAELKQWDIHLFHSTARVGQFQGKKKKHMLQTHIYSTSLIDRSSWLWMLKISHFHLLTVSVSVFWSHSSQYIQSSSSSFECLKKVFRPFSYRVTMKKIKYTLQF